MTNVVDRDIFYIAHQVFYVNYINILSAEANLTLIIK